jgi:hypothetical protein
MYCLVPTVDWSLLQLQRAGANRRNAHILLVAKPERKRQLGRYRCGYGILLK